MGATYEVTSDQDNIVIRLPRQSTDPEMLMKFLDYLELESIRRRSQLTEEGAEDLASSVKRGAWEQVKHLFKEA